MQQGFKSLDKAVNNYCSYVLHITKIRKYLIHPNFLKIKYFGWIRIPGAEQEGAENNLYNEQFH